MKKFLKLSLFFIFTFFLAFPKASDLVQDADLDSKIKPEKKDLYPKDSLETLWNSLKLKNQAPCKKTKSYFLYSKANYDLINGNERSAEFSSKILESLNPSKYAFDVRAKILYSKGDFESFKKLPILEKPDQSLDLETNLIIANSLENLGDLKKAEKFFEFLEEKYPESEQVAYFSVLRCLRSDDDKSALEKIESFLNRVNLRAKHSTFYHLKAVILAKNPFYDLKKIIEILDSGLELNPRSEKILKLKFLICQRLGNKEKSNEVLKELCDLTENPELKKLLITRYFEDGDFKSALEQISNMQGQGALFLYNQALILFKMKEFYKSEEVVLKALELEPKNRSLNDLYFQILICQKRAEKIVEKLILDLKKKPFNKDLLIKIVALSKKCFQPKELVRNLGKIYKESKNPNILLAAAEFSLNSELYQKAINAYNAASKIFKGDSEILAKIFFGRSQAFYNQENFKAAKKDLVSALKEYPAFPQAYSELAKIYFLKKKPSKALAFLDKALNLSPFDFKLHLFQGQALFNLGFYSRARNSALNSMLLNPLEFSIEKISGFKSISKF